MSDMTPHRSRFPAPARMLFCKTVLACASLVPTLSASASDQDAEPVPQANPRIEVDSASPVAADRYNEALASRSIDELCVAGACDTPPALLAASAPVYPPDLIEAGTEGRAVVVLDIDPAGMPRNVAVHSATHEGFGAAAVEAVMRWTFRPATLGGKPVEYKRALQIFPFELRD